MNLQCKQMKFHLKKYILVNFNVEGDENFPLCTQPLLVVDLIPSICLGLGLKCAIKCGALQHWH